MLGDKALIKDNFVLFLATFVLNVLAYVFHIFVGRFLGPGDYGIFGSLLSLIYLNDENVFEIKKKQRSTGLTQEQILKFAEHNDLDLNLIKRFLKYNTGVTGKEVMDKYQIKPGPEMGKYIKQMELDRFKEIQESVQLKYIKTFNKF